MKKIFSFDAETNGLWGQPFSIAAIVYEGGKETARFVARLGNDQVTNDFVIKNVLPAMTDVPVTHKTQTLSDWSQIQANSQRESYESMIGDFAAFYQAHKQGADVICHMGYIVEAHVLREMHRLGFIGDWDAPYPLLDVSGNLQAAGEDPTSVDAYAKKYGIEVTGYGSTHNPLYDCEVAARCYMHLLKPIQ